MPRLRTTDQDQPAGQAPAAPRQPRRRAAAQPPPPPPAPTPPVEEPAEEPVDELPSRTPRPVVVRKPQLRILQCLSRARSSLPEAVICERAKVARTAVLGMLGSPNLTSRATLERSHNYKCLLNWGYVEMKMVDVHGDGSEVQRAWRLTEAGREFILRLREDQDE